MLKREKEINWMGKSRHILIILAVILMGLFLYRSHELADASDSINLALKKLVYASSDENYLNSSINAFDGNKDTKWSSEYSDQQWIYVDLASIQSISSVVLYWEKAFAKQYQIQISSDGFSWAIVYTNTNNKGGVSIINFETVQARYVKLYAWQSVGCYGYSLWEFEVYRGKQNMVDKVPGLEYSKGTANRGRYLPQINVFEAMMDKAYGWNSCVFH